MLFYGGNKIMTEFTKEKDVVWKKVKILKDDITASPEHTFYHYEFELPVPLADWDVWDYWEKERFFSMRDNLKVGDVLFDIGTEQGWCNLIYAQFVGPRNMVLIEPTQEFWPNIRQIWYKNYEEMPRGFYTGLLSDKTNEPNTEVDYREWPEASIGDQIDRNKYQLIHENGENIPEMKIDDYVKRSGIIPDALTMDVEGAELLILRGAEETLRKYHPKVWVSVHPDLGERDYGITREETISFMTGTLGYHGEQLATDHEEHWYFWYDENWDVEAHIRDSNRS